MKKNLNGEYVEMTPEEVKQVEIWDKELQRLALFPGVEKRLADIELLLADLIGGAV